MARAKAMTYTEFIEYAQKYYDKGGDSFVECWEDYQFDEYVKLFGPITKSKALAMFRLEHLIQKEMAGWF